MARTGANAQQVIDGVKARIAQISPGLPPGVRIVPFYDRSTLIGQAVDTLRITLLEEIALVTLAHVVFLMHVRSILVVTLPLPLAVLISFLGMYYAGISSNIMSLAGIAIAIGVLVDAGIVVTENAFRQIERSGIDVRDRRAVWRAVLESTRLVGRPVFFSMAIIVLAFVPVFALTGQAGKLFQPLAFTKTFAVLAATLLAVTLVPVLCTLLLGGKLHDEAANPVMRGLRAPVSAGRSRRRSRTDGLTICAAALRAGRRTRRSATRIGNEFMPPLNEGDLLFMPISDPSISLDQNTDIARMPEHGAHAGAGGRVRRGEGRPRRHVHRSVAAEHDGNGRPPQTARPVAARTHARPAPRRAGTGRAAAGRHQHLDDADHQPDRHADDRRAIGDRRQGLRHRSGGAGRDGATGCGGAADGAGRGQRVSRNR